VQVTTCRSVRTRPTAHEYSMNRCIKIILTTAAVSATLAGCAPSYADPKQAIAFGWLKSGDAGHRCPPAERATSPLRSDLELAAPEHDFMGMDGAERWKVRATGDGYDRLVIVREDPSGKLCVATDSALR